LPSGAGASRSSDGRTLAECAGVFAADLSIECARPAEPRAPLRGEVAGPDGFVAGPGGPIGDELAESVAPDPPPAPDKHCNGPVELATAATPHLAALRDCVSARKDSGGGCDAAGDAPCPPTASEAECAHAREVAADICKGDEG
jgi:hypothetical protein